MATNVGSIELIASIDTSDYKKGAKEIDSANSQMEGSVTKATSKSDKAWQSFSDNVSKYSKIIAVAGVAAVAGLTKASVSAFADYEQLVGGVDTLFKANSKDIQDYADMAYKTAGLSANAYMETVTSFSASLLQGLGGDTKAASRIANLAVTDMADNANKMGTSIEMIQNAYQGFAKDNFTMLDNLKLGYGGTAGEMARLVNESGVMGKSFEATAENVKDIPFDQLILAINKVQTEMGITGTTAKEAAETISGSLASTRASWTNLLTAFGTGDGERISAAFDGLVESGTNFVQNVANILPGIFKGIGHALGLAVKDIPVLGSFFEFVVKHIDIFKSLAVGIGAVVTAIKLWQIATVAMTIAQGALNAVMALNPITVVIMAVAALVAGLIYFFTQTETGRKMWEAFTTSIVKAWASVSAAVKGAWDYITGTFNKLYSFFSGLWNSIVGLFGSVGVRIGDAISGAVKGAINRVLSGGINLINGFINSINSVVGVINKLPGVDIGKIGKLPIPQLAEGGVVTAPTLALIGEGGEDEAVIPLSKLDDMMNKGNVTINLQGVFATSATEQRRVAQQIADALGQIQQARGY